MPSNLRLWCLAGALCCAACDERVGADQDARAQVLPSKLSETGLLADLSQERLAVGVFPYAPEFVLWSDGASKRRWLSIGSAPRLTVLALTPAEDHAAPLQLLAEGHVDCALGTHISLSALVQAPVGRPLGVRRSRAGSG